MWSTKMAPWPSAANAPCSSERHGAKIVIVADAGEDEVGAVCRLGGAGGTPAAEPGDPSLGFGARAVEHHDVMMSARLEMAGQGKAHHAEPDPSDFAHWLRSN